MKGTVLIIGSNTTMLRLKNNHIAVTGNYLNELVVPILALQAAGYDVVIATPNGIKPPLDPRSIASSYFAGDKVALQGALDFYKNDIAEVLSLREVILNGLESFLGFFVPGGYAPITDLPVSAELGDILRHANALSKPTALSCHAPIALVSAMRDPQAFVSAMLTGNGQKAAEAARDWPYCGYRMTTFSDSEEALVSADMFGADLLYSVADALRAGGAFVEVSDIRDPFVTMDRELVTGQNPASVVALTMRFIGALDSRSSMVRLQPSDQAFPNPDPLFEDMGIAKADFSMTSPIKLGYRA